MFYSDVLIAGAGAAGLTAAIFAAQSGSAPGSGFGTQTGKICDEDSGSHPEITLLERTNQPGRKILMSGGTRCNVLPVEATKDDFITESSPNRLRNVFKSWSVEGCHEWFSSEIGLDMACEKASNKWFPKSNSAKEVRDLLVKRARKLGVTIRTSSSVTDISRTGEYWKITTASGETHIAPKVILATGGMSIPRTGTDGTGHSIMQQLGHSLHEPYPALTPLKGPHPGREPLPGVSLDVDIVPEARQSSTFGSRRSGFLFTHDGYSGPAVLDVSHVAVKALADDPSGYKAALRVNWADKGADWWREQLQGSLTTSGLLAKYLPRRLADNLLEEAGLQKLKTAQLTKKQRNLMISMLTEYRLVPTGHAGFSKAEVTGGGVPIDEINPATMESRILPGIYLCGEILDVFGRIGGFNFYWAWVSGRLAGRYAVTS
ncbi:NAD(P)/FAD-dependent oxidoreductase [Natronogracilivirga saccharolytica]|uniref:Aminoacetone oxidase family FAD-binding enzyme n=1 Tax=Natronogracilivirga saccharolytica TaxID=2812953 RepID=A0A8J7RJS9_9BACT|nr:aminoacetone oxidase family FAD-binding enzyme [Natronogracilivirga saccharolytica]MBP3193030.1 aminoacetone oxidase family FAD-binding enzyme [Natronogracilivirga saccharolytica]